MNDFYDRNAWNPEWLKSNGHLAPSHLRHNPPPPTPTPSIYEIHQAQLKMIQEEDRIKKIQEAAKALQNEVDAVKTRVSSIKEKEKVTRQVVGQHSQEIPILNARQISNEDETRAATARGVQVEEDQHRIEAALAEREAADRLQERKIQDLNSTIEQLRENLASAQNQVSTTTRLTSQTQEVMQTQQHTIELLEQQLSQLTEMLRTMQLQENSSTALIENLSRLINQQTLELNQLKATQATPNLQTRRLSREIPALRNTTTHS